MAQKKLTHGSNPHSGQQTRPFTFFSNDVCSYCLKMLIPDHGHLVKTSGKKGHIVKSVELNCTDK